VCSPLLLPAAWQVLQQGCGQSSLEPHHSLLHVTRISASTNRPPLPALFSQVLQQVRPQPGCSPAIIETRQLDLGSLASVRKFCHDYNKWVWGDGPGLWVRIHSLGCRRVQASCCRHSQTQLTASGVEHPLQLWVEIILSCHCTATQMAG
jgi:hypothetical protein